ncbi:MAG TPA: metallophosphoesterase [Patescibacteria group bacterium]|nr:metallophosphoesterase [Patescibacteria group bacterium]
MIKLIKVLSLFLLVFAFAFVLKQIQVKTEEGNISEYEETSIKTDNPLIAAVGDIQCDHNIFSQNNCPNRIESIIAGNNNPYAILLLGDEQYGHGTLQDFQNSLDQNWANYITKIFPVPGNHDYLSELEGYKEYFKDKNPRIPLNNTYYSFDINNWHLVALDSNCSQVGGCGKTSQEYKWLAKDLSKNTKKCVLAYFHHPLFSSGTHGNNYFVKDLWNLLYMNKADLILNGHEHVYERFAPQDPNGKIDNKKGVRQITVGTGGGPLYKFKNIKPNSQFRDNKDYGLLLVNLEDSSYSFKFVNTDNKIIDSGTAKCN